MFTDELSFHWNSPMGLVSCNLCEKTWPCHLSAWGSPTHKSSCKNCKNGILTWKLMEND